MSSSACFSSSTIAETFLDLRLYSYFFPRLSKVIEERSLENLISEILRSNGEMTSRVIKLIPSAMSALLKSRLFSFLSGSTK